METLNLFIEEIKSQPWQFNVGFLTIIPSYIFTIKVLYDKKVGLKKKIDKAQKKGNVAQATIYNGDAYKLRRNRSRRVHGNMGEYYSAKYTYVVNGKTYCKTFRSDPREHTGSPLREKINVYWLDNPKKAFWSGNSNAIGYWYRAFCIFYPWIFFIVFVQILTALTK